MKLAKGIMVNGKNLLISFSHDGKRYRVTTNLEALQVNVNKAIKLLTSIKIDLERGQFLIANYKHQISNIKYLEHLDSNYDLTQNQISMTDLINEQMTRYQTSFETGNIAIGTWHCYRYAINKHLLPYFESKALDEFNLELLEQFIGTIKLSKKRINLILQPLKQIMKRAKKMERIELNPFDSLESESWQSQVIKSSYKVEPFSTNEVELILKTAEHPAVKNILQTGFWTGMRIGEMFALDWSDIDFRQEIIHVNKSQTIQRIIKCPKTKAGIRTVEMTPLAKQALLAQYQITGNDLDQRVFKTPTGKTWLKPDNLGRYWKNILIKANINHRNLYQMRHTFISQMLELGNSPMILYRMVGHENAEMIYKNYGRFINQGTGVKLLRTEK